MRLRNIPRARDVIQESSWTIKDPESHKGSWRTIFENDHPIRLEIGTGKCQFIIEMAMRNPDINYIGIEKFSSVLLRGVERQEELQLPNLRFVRAEAELITEFFTAGEIDLIYLNFSDPWPKKRTAKRRLPSGTFLGRYNEILAPGGTIEFKTDNRELFDYAVLEVPGSAFEIREITYDLHHDPVMNEGNVQTEYEERFSAKGNPICKYILGRRSPEGQAQQARIQAIIEAAAIAAGRENNNDIHNTEL